MRVRAITLCFVENGLRNPGDEFEYSGPPSRHLEPVSGSWPAKRPRPAAKEADAAREPKQERKPPAS